MGAAEDALAQMLVAEGVRDHLAQSTRSDGLRSAVIAAVDRAVAPCAVWVATVRPLLAAHRRERAEELRVEAESKLHESMARELVEHMGGVLDVLPARDFPRAALALRQLSVSLDSWRQQLLAPGGGGKAAALRRLSRWDMDAALDELRTSLSALPGQDSAGRAVVRNFRLQLASAIAGMSPGVDALGRAAVTPEALKKEDAALGVLSKLLNAEARDSTTSQPAALLATAPLSSDDNRRTLDGAMADLGGAAGAAAALALSSGVPLAASLTAGETATQVRPRLQIAREAVAATDATVRVLGIRHLSGDSVVRVQASWAKQDAGEVAVAGDAPPADLLPVVELKARDLQGHQRAGTKWTLHISLQRASPLPDATSGKLVGTVDVHRLVTDAVAAAGVYAFAWVAVGAPRPPSPARGTGAKATPTGAKAPEVLIGVGPCAPLIRASSLKFYCMN